MLVLIGLRLVMGGNGWLWVVMGGYRWLWVVKGVKGVTWGYGR